MLTTASALGIFLVGMIVGAIAMIFFWIWSMKQPGAVESLLTNFFRTKRQAPVFLHSLHSASGASSARLPRCPMCDHAATERGATYCDFHNVGPR